MSAVPSTTTRRTHTRPTELSSLPAEPAITRLLVAIKLLLESLTLWSNGKMTETQVSDAYVYFGNDFNAAIAAFNAYDIDTRELLGIPDEMREVLEEILSYDPSPSNSGSPPAVREIITRLLQDLRKKQSIYRRTVPNRRRLQSDKHERHRSNASQPPLSSGSNSESRHTEGPQVESAIPRLLISVERLLESLTLWSNGKMTETQVSDTYARFDSDFHTVVTTFTAYSIDMGELLGIPDELKGAMEESLSYHPSPSNLEKILPTMREIVDRLLQHLRNKRSTYLRVKYHPTTPDTRDASNNQPSEVAPAVPSRVTQPNQPKVSAGHHIRPTTSDSGSSPGANTHQRVRKSTPTRGHRIVATSAIPQPTMSEEVDQPADGLKSGEWSTRLQGPDSSTSLVIPDQAVHPTTPYHEDVIDGELTPRLDGGRELLEQLAEVELWPLSPNLAPEPFSQPVPPAPTKYHITEKVAKAHQSVYSLLTIRTTEMMRGSRAAYSIRFSDGTLGQNDDIPEYSADLYPL